MLRSVAALLLLACVGCVARPDLVVLLPDSPVLIVEVRGKYVHLVAYSKADNEMVEVGWTTLTGYEGRTLHNFDWEALIAREKEGETDGRRTDTD